ncbi:hypothetical protein PILCRDRAFT_506477 [Piloderma croceum F 1598]|uniref:RING-type domain-containing protein n=1 Tax=Piloderma croceum (strain F 1598) TaxID=765440 RepID=A0A0C3BV87_PILCF|nr:hypothetical protein PILCRDRAFT_506477 [Piloderma croceum F 1598]
MLVLHPTSRCDVCLDDYTWVTPANSPHAISCGHIFCLTCLRALHPSSCPLCRKNFQPDRVKKLHVDKAPQEPDGTNVLLDSHSAVLLQRVAMVSGENTPDEDVMEVLNDVTEWLSTQSNDLSSVSHFFLSRMNLWAWQCGPTS